MTTKKIDPKASKKRGRPRQFDLDKAISTALDLFHRRGYDGVGVAELSKSMGITAPSLYSAFGNKRSLFERVLRHYIQTRGCWLPTALATEGELESTITHFFSKAAEIYTDDPERCGCLVMDATRNCSDEEAKALTAGMQQATRGLICDRIKTGAPNLSETMVNALSNYVLMILVGLSGSARDGVSTEALQLTAKTAAAGFISQLHEYQSERKAQRIRQKSIQSSTSTTSNNNLETL